MRAILQRVTEASVTVGDETVGRIGHGALILVCAMEGDEDASAVRMASRIARLRVFRDEAGRMNRSLLDTGGEALIVSQFTLAADTSRGNRPGFSAAAPPDLARALCDRVVEELAAAGIPTATGRFGADMAVVLINDGPVTIQLET